ncbi:MAG: lipoyl domain-containing protein [Deltaproteobacteria bacterium]|nr:lipoyl domain-containing protein [Deltaproteobacteria bacterium]
MSIEVAVPSLGEAMTSVEIGRWHKQPGDAVALDDTLVELITDKADIMLPSPVAGTLVEQRVATGTRVDVGVIVAVIAAR